MKKLFALLAVAFGVMSCQADVDDFGANVGGEQDVNILVSLPEATRASENGAFGNVDFDKYDIEYFFQVFDATNDDNCKAIQTKVCDDKEVSFPVRLIAGREYRFVVWAHLVDAEGHAHYTVGETLKDIKLNEEDCWVAMDDTRDAYTGVKRATFNGSSDIAIELTRPFAKLRVVTTDMEELLGVEPVSAVVNYIDTEFYTSFNALTETPADKDLTKGHAYEIKSYGETGAKKTLFADYFFAKDGDFVKFNIAVAMNDGQDAIEHSFTTNIPVKRNTLTTIEGNILTEGDDITVKVEEEFENADKIEDAPYYVEIWDGESQTQPEITVDQTTGEQVAVIGQASELAWLAAFVNGTLTEGASTFATRAGEVEPVKFVLGADIDLGGFPWTPIGYNPNDEAGNENYFTGVFDGQNHKIYNLNIDVKDKGGVGFFGAVNNATIKNITFENVFVKAVESEEDPKNSSGAEGKTNYIVGGHIGAVVGYDAAPWGTGEVNFENVHVTGLVQIEGETRAAQGQRIGGIIGGRGYSKMSFKNVSVNGAEGSYIKGYCSTAGVSGQIQGVTTYEDVTTDIDVYAVTFGAGGIAGIVTHGSTFTNCSTKGNVTLDASKTQLSSYSANYPFRVGGIAGCWSDSKTGVLTLTNCSYEGTLTSIDRDGNSPENFDYAGFVGRGYSLKNCAGSKVIVNNDEYVQAYETTYGVYYVNGNYEVNTAADLKALANDVNTGKDYFEGKTVVLTADIDLNGEEWTPIGSASKEHGFMGNFDGKGFAIKNLAIKNIALDSDGYAYAGLFGVTEGVDQNTQNYIKNLTIENVNIKTTGHIVAAAIAYPYYTVVENVTVKGNVSIKGGDYTAGVLAYTRRCVDAKNLTIAGNNGSAVEGRYTVGGVISDIQMNGGLTANYSNFAASGLTIKGDRNIGGIAGIIGGQSLNGAKVENVTIVSNDIRKGILVGSLGNQSAINNVVVNNVTGAHNYVGANWEDGSESSVTIDGVVYEYLANGQIKVNGSIIVADGVILNEAEEYIISNAAGMFWFANEVNVNKNKFDGKIVKLGADINLENAAWTPVGQTGATTFNGVFDGENYTISNLNVNSEAQTGAHYSSGLFGWVESHTAGHGHLKNVKIEGATINGHHNCGALVGYITQETALVENCHVTGATVTCTKANNDADGDKAGALIGNATVATPVKNCTAANSTVSAGRDAGQVIGAGKEANVTGCSATNVAVSANETSTGKNIRNEVIGRLL